MNHDNLDLRTLKEIKNLLQSEMELVWNDNDPHIFYNQGIEHCIAIIEYIYDEEIEKNLK
jgi:uncharacterized protein (DUF2164 family)